MKLQTTTNEITQIGATQAQAFSMRTSRKMFEILSGLYSDTELAIVRELSCNAVDAHFMAGKETTPFHIHLPNALEPWIIIQDFGTGISHQNIYDIYTVYGASTKENTNSQIGCLGLGSKSPFAYTDNFIITSIVKGEKRIYNAFFNEQNTPSVALLSTEETTEPNGLSVQIPVKAEDFYKFEQAVEKALRFFAVKPTVSGGSVKWTDDKWTFEGTGWKSYTSFNYNECYAVMGGVAYPVDKYKVDNKHHALVERGGIVMYFEMGELDFTPSREQLDYCKFTVDALNNKLATIYGDLIAKIGSTIESKSNIFDALQAVSTIHEKFQFLGNTVLDGTFKWGGVDISKPQLYVRQLIAVADPNAVPHHYFHNPYGRSKVRDNNEVRFDCDWYVDDLAKGTYSRAKSFIKNNNSTTKRLIIFSDVVVKHLIASGFPVDMFIKTSTLPKVVRAAYVKSANGASVPATIKMYCISDYWRQSWKSANFDPANPPMLYLVKPAGETSNDTACFVKNDKLSKSLSDQDGIKKFLQYAGVAESEFVVIAERNEKHLVAAGSINFSVWLDELLNKINLPDTEDIKMYDTVKDSYRYDENLRMITAKPKFKNLDEANPFRVYCETLNKVSKKVSPFKLIMNYLDISKFTTPSTPAPVVEYSPVMKLLISRINSWDVADLLTITEALENKDTNK